MWGVAWRIILQMLAGAGAVEVVKSVNPPQTVVNGNVVQQPSIFDRISESIGIPKYIVGGLVFLVAVYLIVKKFKIKL